MKPTWYAIRRLTAIAAAAVGAQAAAEIQIYGDIGESWWDETVTAKQFVKDINALDVDQITVRINSLGGSVPDGLAIHNAIKRHRATVTTEVDGMAFSIASLIAVAGDKRRMAANALMMVHAPWTVVGGNSMQLRTTADMLDTWAAAMATSYVTATGKPDAEIMGLLTDGVDHYYTAAEAQAFGLIDEISDAVAPAAMAGAAGAAGLQTRYRDVPAAWLQACGVSPAAPAANPPAALAATPAAAAVNPQENLMTGSVNPAGGQPVAVDAADIAAQAVAADRARRDAIKAALTVHAALPGINELIERASNDVTITPEAAGLQALALIGAHAAPVGGALNGPAGIRTVEDETDKVRGAMVQAIMARSGQPLGEGGKRVQADASNPYRGRPLLEIARACLVRAGVDVSRMGDPRELVAASFTQSGSDFPILLANTMHKSLLAGYVIQQDTWTLFCAQGSVSDFRAHNRYRTGSLSNLEVKNELGEYRTKVIPDGERASITAGTKGNLINISREAVINDDLGAFTELPSMMGRAAKRTVESDVYTTAFAVNGAGFGPTLSDGLPLFHATHLNLAAVAAAPTVASFEAARVQLRAQKDVSGNDFLELEPAVWLGPDSIVGQAKVVNNSTFDPDANNKLQRANIAAGLVRTIQGTPRLTGTPWFIFADPAQAPVLEVAFLNGLMEPYFEVEQAFSTDGARMKVRLDYGIAGRDFRGAVRNAGA